MGTSWIKHLTQEFTLKKCSLKAKDPQLILQSQWRFHPVVWLFYRVFMAAYSLIWCICSGVQTNSLKWFIFLTHLTYTMLTTYFNLALVNFICYITFGQKKESQNIKEASLTEMPLSSSTAMEIEGGTSSTTTRKELLALPSVLQPTISTQWALHNLTCVTSLYVTVAFWTIDYIPGGAAPDSVNINVHVVNSVLALLELGMTAAPIHLIHFVCVLLYCMAFILFTVIYWAAGGTNLKGEAFIYRMLDYGRNPAAATGCIVGSICIIMPILQFLVWNLHLFKRHMYLRLVCKDGDVPRC